ncbi:putative G-protein coupled receptor 141 [Astyanax mexicanus]|uniref:Putative G-protein coupled receptor 141 n=1 Tax=Astyanax mexicanus TaxID=7994 RepID=A0A8T2MS15_ASTMX|nr:putative G-protein coupled receptor 141 [Astyanax mexicanus]
MDVFTSSPINMTTFLPSSNTTNVTTTSTITDAVNKPLSQSSHRIALIIIYTVVLVTGTVGLVIMIRVLKTNLRSWTTIAFLNLLLAHVIFLLTVPFRIHYYVTNHWSLSPLTCKIVSAMIHLHMYVVFVIYVAILVTRFVQYYKKTDRMEFYRRLHALAASVGIWSILIIVGPIILSKYGTKKPEENKCFNFGQQAIEGSVFGFNIFLSVVIILVSCILGVIVGIILYSLIKKYGAACRNQQEFWAQMRNINLIIIIFICLVPYHLFRFYYLTHTQDMEESNEVFLSITTLTCTDMLLIFTKMGIFQVCGF